MKQNEFFDRLKRELKGLPTSAIDEIVADYREYIGDAMAAGRSEDAVIAALGDPVKLARELKAQASYRQWEAQRSFGNLMRVVLSVAGLGLLQLLLLGPFLLYLLMLTVGYVASSALTVAGLCSLVMLGGHSLFGWPGSSSTFAFDSSHTSAGTHGASAIPGIPAIPGAPQISIRSSSTSGASAAQASNVKAQFGNLKIDGKRLVLRLDDDAHAQIQLRNGGSVNLGYDSADDSVTINASNPAALTLVKREGDDSVSVARDDVQALDFQGNDDSHLSIKRGDSAQAGLAWNIRDSDGSVVSFDQDAQGRTTHFNAHASGSNVSIGANGIAIDDGNDHVHISGLGSHSIEGMGLRYGVILLPIGLVGLLICIWLTRITWRALVRYTQHQVEALSHSIHDPSAG